MQSFEILLELTSNQNSKRMLVELVFCDEEEPTQDCWSALGLRSMVLTVFHLQHEEAKSTRMLACVHRMAELVREFPSHLFVSVCLFAKSKFALLRC